MYPFKETGDEDAVLSVLPREDYDWPLELGVDNVDDPSLGRSPVYFGSDDEAALSMPYDSIFGNSNGFGLQAEDFQGSQMPQLEFPIVREQRHQPFYSPLREVAPIVQGVPEAVEQYGLPDANYLPMEQPGNYHEWAQLYGFPPTVSSHSSQVVQQRAQTLTTWPPLEHPSLAQQMAQTTQTTHALGPPPGPIYTHIKPRLVSRPTESLVTPRPILPLVEPVSLPTKQPTTPVSEHTPSDVQSTRDRYDAVPRSFMTADEAKSYRTRVRKMPNPDTTVSEIEENKVAWVGFVYQAMISLDQAMDRPKETLTGKATANHDFAAWVGCTYDQKEVEAAAWHVVEACLKLHKVGRQFEDRYDKAKVADRELNCEQRIRACCNLFRAWKSACTEVVRGRNVKHLVNHPNIAMKTKDANKTGNLMKAETLAKGREVMSNLQKTEPVSGRPTLLSQQSKGDSSVINSKSFDPSQGHQTNLPFGTHPAQQSMSRQRSAAGPALSLAPSSRKRHLQDSESDEDYVAPKKRR